MLSYKNKYHRVTGLHASKRQSILHVQSILPDPLHPAGGRAYLGPEDPQIEPPDRPSDSPSDRPGAPPQYASPRTPMRRIGDAA